jgi:hypothetical protein
MPWTHIKDRQARQRGYYFQAHMPQFTIYKNCKTLNVYVIRLQHKYTEYLMKHDGTKPVEIMPNFTPVLLEDNPFAIPTDHKITVLDITTPEIERDHEGQWVDPEPEDELYQVTILPQTLLWTPVITPCSPACHAPYQIRALTTYEKRNPKFTRYRCLAVDTLRLDTLPWFSTNFKCSIHTDDVWQTTLLDIIPLYRCSAEPRLRSLHNNNVKEEDAVRVQFLYTFSYEKGYSGLNKDMFKLAEEEIQLDLPSPTDREWLPPAYPCSPGCLPPTEVSNLKISYCGDVRQWYRDLAMNIHILFTKQWEDTNEMCDVNSNFAWQTIQFKSLPIYKCSGNHQTTLTNLYSPTHTNRWALAYSFTVHQLKTLKWEKIHSVFRAKLHRATISMNTLESTYYSVTNDLGQHCTFEVQWSDVARPMDRAMLHLTHQRHGYVKGATINECHGVDVNWHRVVAMMNKKDVPTPSWKLKRQIEQIMDTAQAIQTPHPHPNYQGSYLQAQRRRKSPVGHERVEEARLKVGTDIQTPTIESNKLEAALDTSLIEAQLLQLVSEGDNAVEDHQSEDEDRAQQQFDKLRLMAPFQETHDISDHIKGFMTTPEDGLQKLG